MDLVEIFQVLGIETTKDEGAIRNAYREKLLMTNPEDDPEGFKKLREAYEKACAYVKQADKKEQGKPDDTPSGVWVSHAEVLYRNINTRCDVNGWSTLFDEDIFLSLEEENCRIKLLRFLMNHFMLPTEVWKLLDRKLDIVSKADDLREKFPADFVNYIVGRCERGEEIDFSQFEGEPEAPYDQFLQYYECCWNALKDKNLDLAESYIKNAEELHIFHPVIEVCRAYLLMERDQIEDAIACMKVLQERFPEDIMICYNAAELLWNHERKEEAAEIYLRLKRKNHAHYMANVRLTEWYYENGQYEAAKKCAKEVPSSSADEIFVQLLIKVNREIEKELEPRFYERQDYLAGLELCWCYLQDGRISEGIRVAELLQGKLSREKNAEHKALLAKLYLEETEYEQAIFFADAWEQELQQCLKVDREEEKQKLDRDHIKQSHLIRMQSYRSLGDMWTKRPEERRELYEKAVGEAQVVMDGSRQDIGILMELTQIYMGMEEYEKCQEVIRKLEEEYQVYAAYATEAELFRKQWNAAGVVRSGRECIRYFPNYTRAYELMAKVYLDLKYEKELEELLAEAGKNNIESDILEAFRYQMTHDVPEDPEWYDKVSRFLEKYLKLVENGDLGIYEKQLPVLTEYLYRYPIPYTLSIRGSFHMAARHYEEAKVDFEKALTEEPRYEEALKGMSALYRHRGDYEKALIYLKRAKRYALRDQYAVIDQDMANLYSLLGNYKEALKSYEEYAKRNGFFTNANGVWNKFYLEQLAQYKARCGSVAEARKMVDRAFQRFPLERFEHLVGFYQVNGGKRKAAALLKKWEKMLGSATEKQKEDSYIKFYIRQAWQSLIYGEAGQAVDAFEKVVELQKKSHNPSENLRDAIFACILCGNEKRGKEYASRLRLYMAKAKRDGRNDYANREKSRVQMEFLAVYYKEPEETLEQILERGEQAEVCCFCDYCICKELEAMRLLLMIRRGQREDAMECLKRNQKRQPFDEYMLAIQNVYGEKKTVASKIWFKIRALVK